MRNDKANTVPVCSGSNEKDVVNRAAAREVQSLTAGGASRGLNPGAIFALGRRALRALGLSGPLPFTAPHNATIMMVRSLSSIS